MASTPPVPVTVPFYTWNTQGNFTEGGKGDIVRQMMNVQQPPPQGGFGEMRPAIACLQEGGVNLGGNYPGYVAVAGSGVGAFNERCTNYVLLNEAWVGLISGGGSVNQVTISDPRGSAIIGGGIAGRTPAAVAIERNLRTLVISWHSTASGDNSDTRWLFRTLQKSADYADYDQIIVGGDFNASPDEVEWLLISLAAERGDTNFGAQIVRSGYPTLKRDPPREYDYFVVFWPVYRQNQTAQRIDVLPSDHYPVRTDLALFF